MVGLLKIYFIYIIGSTFVLSWRVINKIDIAANYIDAIFLIVSIHSFIISFSLYKLFKNEDKEIKIQKIMANQRLDYSRGKILQQFELAWIEKKCIMYYSYKRHQTCIQ